MNKIIGKPMYELENNPIKMNKIIGKPLQELETIL